ncbi:hypothetical protein PsW64_03146 [Pseudovibrio sp. W64]|uniref:hypothetical protein n=1 Tax=Pseudovibrio sp. W64 TaxID=1735583 RepID=UPI0007AE480C|nr:hypothetical protein [Pseudovibrio sp. W64]KZK79516.1 hypothetical protein PsW64_03146 [Pseudovibrio sp. W64]
MKIRKFMGVCLLTLNVGLPSAQADVYWADDGRLVPDRVLNMRPDEGAEPSLKNPSIRQALEHSSQRMVREAFLASGDSDLYLLLRDEHGLWHPGGTPPGVHVTVEVRDGREWIATCHVFHRPLWQSELAYDTTC